MTFEASAAMGDSLRGIYRRLGYEVVELPLSGPADRVAFMLDNLPHNS
jgi:predicted ATPase